MKTATKPSSIKFFSNSTSTAWHLTSTNASSVKKVINFLGYEVSVTGIKPTEERVKTISTFPKPKTVVELRRFLGMINFYRDCLPRQAELQIELNKYLHNKKTHADRVDVGSGECLWEVPTKHHRGYHTQPCRAQQHARHNGWRFRSQHGSRTSTENGHSLDTPGFLLKSIECNTTTIQCVRSRTSSDVHSYKTFSPTDRRVWRHTIHRPQTAYLCTNKISKYLRYATTWASTAIK